MDALLWLLAAAGAGAVAVGVRMALARRGAAAAARRSVGSAAAGLPDAEAERVRRLEERRTRILELAGGNRNLAGELLHEELAKVDELVASFTDLAASCARWERHLKVVDFEELERETRKHESDAGRALDAEQRRLAQRHLEVLLERRTQLAEMRRKVTHARAQLDLIESTFLMLANQVVLMSSPRELGAQLDDLRVGVEAVREMTTGDGQPETAQAARAPAPAETQRSR